MFEIDRRIIFSKFFAQIADLVEGDVRERM